MLELCETIQYQDEMFLIENLYPHLHSQFLTHPLYFWGNIVNIPLIVLNQSLITNIHSHTVAIADPYEDFQAGTEIGTFRRPELITKRRAAATMALAFSIAFFALILSDNWRVKSPIHTSSVLVHFFSTSIEFGGLRNHLETVLTSHNWLAR